MNAVVASQAEQLFTQGLEWHRQGQLALALAAYEQALQLQPGHFDALHHIGILAYQAGELPVAEQFLQAALAGGARVASVHSNLGNVLKAAGRFEEALASYDRAIALDAANADAHYNRGNTLQTLGCFEQALASYDRAIALQASDAQAWNNRAVVLQELKRFDEALESLDAVLTLNPDHAEARNNRGNVLARLGRHEDALDSFARLLACRPDYADALVNRAKVSKDLGRFDASQADLEHAIALAPELAAAHWNLGLLSLLRGRLAEGWQCHEWRWRIEPKTEPRSFDQPLWLGEESLAGRTILLWAEQGLGDTLQFCRYAELAKARGATVILEVQQPLAGLLAPLAHHVVAKGDPLPPFDYQCPLMSLPLAFGTELDTIPWQGPYLHADREREQAWRERLGPSNKPRVGLAWSGNPRHKNDHKRSIAFAQLAQALSPACEFVSLQKEYRDGDAELLEASPVRDLSVTPFLRIVSSIA